MGIQLAKGRWVRRPRPILAILLLISICGLQQVIAVSQASADPNSLFVAVGGSDTGNCQSWSTACATLAYAVSQAISGATINIGPGTFSISFSPPYDGYFLTFSGSYSQNGLGTTVEPLTPGGSVFGTSRGGLDLENLNINGLQGDAVSADYAGSIDILNSIISNSSTALCACGPTGGITVTDSTISGNGIAVTEIPSAGIGITASTIADNGIGLQQQYGPYPGYSVTTSIVSANQGHDCDLPAGVVLDYGYNLDDDGTCGFSAVNHSQSDVNPNLLPLGNYGGGTRTMPPRPGSPAIDQIPIGGPGCPEMTSGACLGPKARRVTSERSRFPSSHSPTWR